MTRYAVGLGSNLGDRIAHLRAGDAGLRRVGTVTARSSLYETEPIGGPDQDPFLNAVVLLESDLSPDELLAACLDIEAAEGRERSERWGPRTLDLDIITSDGPEVATDALRIPHPLAGEREFVLRPLTEIWPDAALGDGVTASQALDALSPQGVDRLARTWVTDTRTGTWLMMTQFGLILLAGLGILFDGTADLDEDPIIRGLGLVLAVIGAVLGGAASLATGPEVSIHPEPKAGADLRDVGVYGMVRHPMYAGLILMVLGTSLAAASLYGVVASIGLAVVILYKIDYEERRLRIRYPAYASYRRRVPRRLIPGLF